MRMSGGGGGGGGVSRSQRTPILRSFEVMLFIVQGYEVCRTWGIDDLPRSLLRFSRVGDGGRSRTVDLDALKTMLGGSSDKIVDSKAILGFGKQLDHIKARENNRP